MLCALLQGCADFLDAKPDSALAHPSTLKDLRAILDHESFINNGYPGIPEIAADEFYITYAGYATLPEWYRDDYTWEDNGLDAGAYSKPYQTISIANVVLEALDRIESGDATLRKQLRGEALFLRGWMFFQLAQVYCAPYSIYDEGSGLGLVLRLDSDSEVRVGRAGLEQTYRQLFEDLKEALELLPLKSEYLTRPSKEVCYAALARAYLTVEDFEKAEEMVDALLQTRSNLLDYNMLDGTKRYPIELEKNVELLYYGRAGSTGHYMANANTYIDPEVYALYGEHDLRKTLYYIEGASGMRFRGYYHGALADYFAGLAMDEMYLIKAECLARRGEMEEGLRYLNELCKHRYRTGHFYALKVANSEELLKAVLVERRKQLVCRGLRWIDLRRLNGDSRFASTIQRKMYDGNREIVYTLEPGDLRYTFLIPKDAMEVGKYHQNPR